MTPLRTKDLAFVAVALPVATVAAYFWLWRADAAKKLDRLETECRNLAEVDEYPSASACV